MKKITSNSLRQARATMFDYVIPLEILSDYRGEPLSKVLYSWNRHELTPFFPKGTHFSLSMVQAIWLHILDTLRQFGFGSVQMKKVCDYFFKDAYDRGLPEQKFKHEMKDLKKKQLAGTISEEEEKKLEAIKEVLRDKTFLYIIKFEINFLSDLVIGCLDGGEEAGILIFTDGSVIEFADEKYDSHDPKIDVPNKIRQPHLYMSLLHYIEPFIVNEELSKLVMPGILSEDEKYVLREMRNNQIQEIKIKQQKGKVLRVDSNKEGTITGEQMIAVQRIFGLKNYESITLSTRDEKTLTFSRTRKKIN